MAQMINHMGKAVILIILIVKMSHFFRYTWDKFYHVLSNHFKSIKLKLCTAVKAIEMCILTINKVYKKLPVLRYPKEKITVMILSFRTDRPGQTVQTQIRLLLEEQSDQGLHCLPFRLHRLDSLVL